MLTTRTPSHPFTSVREWLFLQPQGSGLSPATTLLPLLYSNPPSRLSLLGVSGRAWGVGSRDHPDTIEVKMWQTTGLEPASLHLWIHWRALYHLNYLPQSHHLRTGYLPQGVGYFPSHYTPPPPIFQSSISPLPSLGVSGRPWGVGSQDHPDTIEVKMWQTTGLEPASLHPWIQ